MKKIAVLLCLNVLASGTFAQRKVSSWLTSPDRLQALTKQPDLLFTKSASSDSMIVVDDTEKFQEMDGFGFTLTGGSATLINRLPEDLKNSILQNLFTTKNDGIGISYLRLTIGASDLSAKLFTYDDMADGQTDTALQHFTLKEEEADLIPVLKKIVKLNPKIKILGSPWTAPTWMKSNKSFIGGSLLPEYYAAYASYFVRYIQEMKKEGITIDAITIQNEPLHPGNNPSMLMLAKDQAVFIKDHLGPAFAKNRIKTKIILYDHNCDKPEYPISILEDAEANKYVDGSAFHLYGGTIDALSKVHDRFPSKHLYFTEQWSDGKGNFGNELRGNTSRLIVGASRNWSRNVLQWNLAADAKWEPHTDKGGCTQCLGAVTIDDKSISSNSSFYVIGHASKFVPAKSVRIGSSLPNKLNNVAFKTPDGKVVLIVVNNFSSTYSFQIKYKNQYAYSSLKAGEVATYVW